VLGEIIGRVSGTDTPDLRPRAHHGAARARYLPPRRTPERQGDLNDLVAVGEQPTPDELEAAIGIRIDLAELIGEVTTEALLAFNQPEVRAAGMPAVGHLDRRRHRPYYQGVLHNRDRLWDPAVLAAGTEPVVDLPDPIRGMPAHRSRGDGGGRPPDAQLRGFGFGVSPATYGHDGAGGRSPGSTRLGHLVLPHQRPDRHVLREARRTLGLSSAPPPSGLNRPVGHPGSAATGPPPTDQVVSTPMLGRANTASGPARSR
jgi:hypothetical protein